MTVTAVNYAKTLYELSVPAEAVQTTKEIFREVPGLKESLANPLVSFEAKSRVIDRVIPDEMKNYVNRMDFILSAQATAPQNCSALSFGDTLYINFTRNIREPELEAHFFRVLRDLGLGAEVQTNSRE